MIREVKPRVAHVLCRGKHRILRQPRASEGIAMWALCERTIASSAVGFRARAEAS